MAPVARQVLSPLITRVSASPESLRSVSLMLRAARELS